MGAAARTARAAHRRGTSGTRKRAGGHCPPTTSSRSAPAPGRPRPPAPATRRPAISTRLAKTARRGPAERRGHTGRRPKDRSKRSPSTRAERRAAGRVVGQSAVAGQRRPGPEDRVAVPAVAGRHGDRHGEEGGQRAAGQVQHGHQRQRHRRRDHLDVQPGQRRRQETGQGRQPRPRRREQQAQRRGQRQRGRHLRVDVERIEEDGWPAAAAQAIRAPAGSPAARSASQRTRTHRSAAASASAAMHARRPPAA